MLLDKFSPPAHLDELSANGLERWSAMLSDLFDQAAAGNSEDPTDSPRAQFFNPLKTEIAEDAEGNAAPASPAAAAVRKSRRVFVDMVGLRETI